MWVILVEVVVRLDGVVARVLDEMVSQGYYKTKTEAIRAGILEMGREYALIGNREAGLVQKKITAMNSELQSGKKKLVPFNAVAKKAGAANDL